MLGWGWGGGGGVAFSPVPGPPSTQKPGTDQHQRAGPGLTVDGREGRTGGCRPSTEMPASRTSRQRPEQCALMVNTTCSERGMFAENSSSSRTQDGSEEEAAKGEVIATIRGKDYRGLIAGWQWEWKRTERCEKRLEREKKICLTDCMSSGEGGEGSEDDPKDLRLERTQHCPAEKRLGKSALVHVNAS